MNSRPDSGDPAQRDIARLLRDEASHVDVDPEQMLSRVRPGRTSASARRGASTRSGLIVAIPMGAVAAMVALIVALSSSWGPGSEPSAPVGPAATSAPVDDSSDQRLQKVVLTSSETRDWIVVAPDQNEPDATVRSAVTEQLLGIGTTGQPAASAATSPFDLSWQGGQPPPSNGTSSRWLEVQASDGGVPSGIDLRVQPANDREELTLYVGVLGAPASLSILLDNEEVTSVQRAVTGPTGSVLTVDLRTYSDDQQVIVRLLAGRDGSVAVAGASLSP